MDIAIKKFSGQMKLDSMYTLNNIIEEETKESDDDDNSKDLDDHCHNTNCATVNRFHEIQQQPVVVLVAKEAMVTDQNESISKNSTSTEVVNVLRYLSNQRRQRQRKVLLDIAATTIENKKNIPVAASCNEVNGILPVGSSVNDSTTIGKQKYHQNQQRQPVRYYYSCASLTPS